MTPYGNLSGNSGIQEYENGIDSIGIRFRGSDKIYVFDDSAPGQLHVETMKKLAVEGRGLAAYVAQKVRGQHSHVE